MALSQKGAGYLRRNNIVDPNVRQALDDLASQIANVSSQANASTQGTMAAPPQVSSLSVTASGGIFDAAIQDNNPVSRGIEYFLEYSLTAVGPWTVVSLGPARNWRGTLGNQTFYWRAYSQYPTSAPSGVIYFGGASSPTAVVGGGTAAGPAPQPSAGSGTAPTNGLSGGQGYGSLPTRSPIPQF
jgi:hypothetical protein